MVLCCMSEETVVKEEFNYCVGHYWFGYCQKGEKGSIGCYTYGGDVHHGTMEDAEAFLAYVKRQSPNDNDPSRGEWQIFKVVPLEVSRGAIYTPDIFPVTKEVFDEFINKAV